MSIDDCIPDDGMCEKPDCHEQTPWDMVSIVVGEKWFCSPNCARYHLKQMDSNPDTIVLHDPQFDVPRDTLPPAVGEEDVNIQRSVTDKADTLTAINEIESMYPTDFRMDLSS